jgi:hypothetical protein
MDNTSFGGRHRFESNRMSCTTAPARRILCKPLQKLYTAKTIRVYIDKAAAPPWKYITQQETKHTLQRTKMSASLAYQKTAFFCHNLNPDMGHIIMLPVTTVHLGMYPKAFNAFLCYFNYTGNKNGILVTHSMHGRATNVLAGLVVCHTAFLS